MEKIEITENVKKVIIEYKDGTKKEVENEPTIYVPENIGLRDNNILLFNDNKSVIYESYRLYSVRTYSEPITNKNNGKNFKLVKTTFGELEVGVVFCEEINFKDELHYYNIKINENESVWVNDRRIAVYFFNNEKEVYKVVKL